MKHVTIPDSILLSVEKPARYIGNEIGAIYKDPEKTPGGTLEGDGWDQTDLTI